MGFLNDLIDIANNEYEPKRKRRNYDEDDDEIRVVGVTSVNSDNTDKRPIRVGVWNSDRDD